MRNIAIAFLCILPGVSTSVAGDLAFQLSGERPADSTEIRLHIDSIFQAYIDKDRDKVRSTHSEDWRGFLRPSTSVVKGIEGYMVAAEAALSGPYGLKGYRFVEYDTVFYDDTAIVSYIAELIPGRTAPIRPRIRVLDVYVKMNAHWIQVASQTAPYPETSAANGE